MSYEANTGLNVSNHYGPRTVGGATGVSKLDGIRNELVIDFAADRPLHQDVYLPSGAVIQDYSIIGVPGAVAVTVGGTDVSTATIDTRATWLTVDVDTTGGLVAWTPGTNEGRLVLQYIHTVTTTDA